MAPDDIPPEAAGDAVASANSSSPKTDKTTDTTVSTAASTASPDLELTTGSSATATTATTTTVTAATSTTLTATSEQTAATDAASAVVAAASTAAAPAPAVPPPADTVADGPNGADLTTKPATTTTTTTATTSLDAVPPSSDPDPDTDPAAAAVVAAGFSLPDSSTATPAVATTPTAAETTTSQPASDTQTQIQTNGNDAKSSSSPAMANSRHLPPSFPLPTFTSTTGSQSPPVYTGSQSPHGMAGGQLPQMTPSTQSPSDPSRASSGAGVSLPSVKSFDPLSSQHHQSQPQQQSQQPQQQQQQQQQPQPQPQQQAGAPIPMHYNQGMHYYGTVAAPHNMYSLPSDPAGMRYAIPPHGDPRFASAPRGPKKEIKRRTKTGCLTCRKRRIKCDEGQPTCNNCRKSKRECAGYDPVFKPQQTSNVQHHTLAANRPPAPSTHSTTPLSHSNPYGSQPTVLPSSYGPLGTSNGPSHPAVTAPFVAPKPEGYLASSPHSVSPPSTLPPAAGGNFLPRAKKMKIDELIGLLGPIPPIKDAPLTDDLFREITRVYHEIYVYGLNAFFETVWFDTRDAKGNRSFPNNKSAVDHFATFLQAIQTTQPNDRASMLSSGILEARLIWVLASLPYTMSPARVNNSVNGLPHPGDPVEIRNRIHVFEALLSGDYIDSNPLAVPVPHADLHRTREFDFWRTLGDYVSFRDEPSISRAVQREEALGRLRLLLDGRENRDLLYSIAIARELSPRYPPGYENAVPQHVDESDPKNKLFVACDFIRREALATGGTTNVVRRFSELANQAFINPGVNVAKAVSPGIVPTP